MIVCLIASMFALLHEEVRRDQDQAAHAMICTLRRNSRDRRTVRVAEQIRAEIRSRRAPRQHIGRFALHVVSGRGSLTVETCRSGTCIDEPPAPVFSATFCGSRPTS